MTHKHFETIAQIVNDHIDVACLTSEEPCIHVQAIAWRLADFQSENPRFDRAKFLKACGVE